MKLFLTFVFAAAMFAQSPSVQVQLSTPAPPVPVANANVSGNPGTAAYVYFVVANYPSGSTFSNPAFVGLAPQTLTSGNFVNIGWSALAGATSYDVIRLLPGGVFTGNCSSCAVASGLTVVSTKDIGSALGTYSMGTPAVSGAGTFYVNTRDYSGPQMRQILNGVDTAVGGGTGGTGCNPGSTLLLLVGDNAGGCLPSSLAQGSVVTLNGTQTLINKTVNGVAPNVFAFLDPTSSIQTQLNGKQATLGFTPMNGANNLSDLGSFPVARNVLNGTAMPTDGAFMISSGTGQNLTSNVTPASLHPFTPVTSTTTAAFIATSTTADVFNTTLSQNVGSSTFTGGTVGESITVYINQGAGGFTFAWPASFLGTCVVNPTASTYTKYTGIWNGANVLGGGCVTNAPTTTGTGLYVLGTAPTITLPNATGLPDGGLSLTNVTTNDASISKHGFAPIYPNDATKYLNGTGVYTVPAGGSAFAVLNNQANTYTGGGLQEFSASTFRYSMGATLTNPADVLANTSTAEQLFAGSFTTAGAATTTTIDGIHRGVLFTMGIDDVQGAAVTMQLRIRGGGTGGGCKLYESSSGASSTRFGDAVGQLIMADGVTAGTFLAYNVGRGSSFVSQYLSPGAKVVCGATATAGAWVITPTIQFGTSTAGTAVCGSITTSGNTCVANQIFMSEFKQ